MWVRVLNLDANLTSSQSVVKHLTTDSANFWLIFHRVFKIVLIVSWQGAVPIPKWGMIHDFKVQPGGFHHIPECSNNIIFDIYCQFHNQISTFMEFIL